MLTVGSLLSLSAFLRQIAQAMIDEQYPIPAEDEEKKDEKKEEKEKAKKEKEKEKEEKKEEKKKKKKDTETVSEGSSAELSEVDS